MLPLVTVLVLLAGCSSGDSTTGTGGTPLSPAPGGAPSVPLAGPSADPSATEDEPGTVACGELAAAINDGTLMNPGVVDAIVAASGTADAPIADASARLAAAYVTAKASAGSEGEPDAVAAVSAVAAEMSEVCGESGLDTVG
ncbi:hypothetical protein Acsp02_46930 [Actinoplanes sp. NBRC 103695]|nr:hypothetical protein Acsp02_46930 [Actinoplanes sp. NBRC 103695]